jgi:hypothetical protein
MAAASTIAPTEHTKSLGSAGRASYRKLARILEIAVAAPSPPLPFTPSILGTRLLLSITQCQEPRSGALGPVDVDYLRAQ